MNVVDLLETEHVYHKCLPFFLLYHTLVRCHVYGNALYKTIEPNKKASPKNSKLVSTFEFKSFSYFPIVKDYKWLIHDFFLLLFFS